MTKLIYCGRVNKNNFQLIFQIDISIFEPQGITELEAEGTFITNDLQNVIKKTFSDKKVQCLMPSIIYLLWL